MAGADHRGQDSSTVPLGYGKNPKSIPKTQNIAHANSNVKCFPFGRKIRLGETSMRACDQSRIPKTVHTQIAT